MAHRLARSLGRLTYARRFLMESLDCFQRAAGHAPTPADAAADLRDAAHCAQIVNDTGLAFDLQVASAAQAGQAGDGDTQAIALARAVELAGRFPATFRVEVPHERLNQLIEQARAAGDPAHPMVAARLACAAAWTAGPDKLTPDQDVAAAAVEAARAAGDPVLVSAALDAVRTAAITAGRPQDAHRVSSERLALLATMDRDDPYAAPEVEDTFGVACADAVAAGDLPAGLSVAHRLLADDLLGDHPYLSTSKVIPAFVLTGDLDLAIGHAETMWGSWERAGCPPVFWMAAAVHFTALAHGLSDDPEGYATWRSRVSRVLGIPNPYPSRLAPLTCFVEARTAVHTGDLTDAPLLVERAFTAVPSGRYEPYARAAGAELAVVAGLPGAADRLAAASAAAAAAGNDWAAACLSRTRGRLYGDAAALAESAAAWQRLGARFEHAQTLLLYGSAP